MKIRTPEQEKVLLEKAYARNPEYKDLIKAALGDEKDLAKYAESYEPKK